MPKLPGRETHKPAPRAPSSVLIDYFLADFLNNQDRGVCALGCGTVIHRSERCAMAVDEADLSKPIGYICGPCTDLVMKASDEPPQQPPDTRFCVLCRSGEHLPAVHQGPTPDLGQPPF